MAAILPGMTAMQVLLVDDDDADIALITEAFDAHRVPAQLHIAHDGIKALDYLRADAESAGPRPDMILLDLNMPRMDDREVLAAVKQDPALATIPIVVFTTSGQPRRHRRELYPARQRVRDQAPRPRRVHPRCG
jgi:CheY-like chemotaxis protein